MEEKIFSGRGTFAALQGGKRMGNVDVAAKNYLQDNKVFADVFNYYLYHGEQRLKPEDLHELDPNQTAQLTREACKSCGSGEKVLPVDPSKDSQKDLRRNAQRNSRTNLQRGIGQNTTMSRDLLKKAVIRTTGQACYVLHLGLEPQSWIDYAMPVRAGAYDFGEYKKQLKQIAKRHKENRDYAVRRKNAGRRRDEYLSGFDKSDKLIPVVTLVLYLGTDKWDGPLSLHEMLCETDPEILQMVADYRLNLITPEAVGDKELQLFRTNLREVLGCIKYSGSREKLERYITDNARMNHLDTDAARLIAATTKTEIVIPKESEEIDMCKAIDDMKRISREEGRAEERANMCKAIDDMKRISRAEGRAEGKAEGKAEERILTARRMFENGAAYDFVRACTDLLVKDQTLREIQASVLAAQGE